MNRKRLVYPFNTLAIACIGVVGLCVGVIAWLVITHYPANHVGFEVRYFNVVAGFSAVLGAAMLFFARTTRGFAVALTAAGLVLLFVVLMLDHYNILVGYDEWLHRGMPSPFGR